ncbi:flavocytochrome c [Alcanivorax xiamenensis]|uniref:Flavocytochrome c n=1 Tax=Alcanivorax xiamenensis TaxID=1177156 RepID=A0ABQ6YBZ9_9GAMM|nr:FAD-binding protein [Alcanivorax xiamenensis]KAF0807652.1 flavocytochrome c [Alcanivorax xiamenensis]
MSNKQTKDRHAVTRRQILKAGATSVLGGLAIGAAGVSVRAQADELLRKWNEEVDVIVVGSGFAGLAAAHEVARAGASVALLEKMRTPGGNSIIVQG